MPEKYIVQYFLFFSYRESCHTGIRDKKFMFLDGLKKNPRSNMEASILWIRLRRSDGVYTQIYFHCNACDIVNSNII